MKKKVVSLALLTIMLIITLTFNIQPVKAEPTNIGEWTSV